MVDISLVTGAVVEEDPSCLGRSRLRKRAETETLGRVFYTSLLLARKNHFVANLECIWPLLVTRGVHMQILVATTMHAAVC